MAKVLALGADDLRIIGHAINWRLNVPYEHTTPPPLTESEQTILSRTFTDVCALHRLCVGHSAANSVSVERGEPYSSADGRMLLPDLHLRLVTDALASFFEELHSSPTEIEVVTGLPPSKTSELLSRLRAA